MRRLIFAALSVAAGLIAAAACDPDLTPRTVPGEGGPEASATDGPPVTPPDDGSTPPSEGGAPDGGGGDSGITHVVDGTNDFAPGEKLDTTSSATSYFAYAAWDTKNVYFGMEGPDVSSGTPNATNKWVMVYLGRPSVAGSTTGLPYNGTTQQPTLAFPASIHLRWKVDGSYSNVQQWNAGASAWQPAAIPFTVLRQGTFVEMGVSRAALGNPATLSVHMNMLIENGNDFTYAGVPSTSFTDGLDPDFGKFFEFDLADFAKAPNTYAPKP